MTRSLFVSFVVLSAVTGLSLSASDFQSASAAGITGSVDHVLVTLPTARFDAIKGFLSERLAGSWKPSETNAKGFILAGDGRTYVELWNAGMFYQAGYQIGVTSNDVNAGEKAKRNFGVNGVTLGGMFTVGSDGPVGHPVGGTFFIDYGAQKRT
jgi:hypothetical protein